MLRIAIVDDEHRQIEELKSFLSRYGNENGTDFDVSSFTSGLQFLDSKTELYDIIFMDIKMPVMDGMETSEFFRKMNPYAPLIFITTMKQMAIEGYRVNALDFLVKPMEYERFASALKRACDIASSSKDRLVYFELMDGVRVFRIDDIDYIEVIKHNLIVHTSRESIRFRCSLTTAEEKLKNRNFARCNNCYLVNLSHVKKIDKNIVTVGQSELTISRPKRKEFIDTLTKFLTDKAA